MDGGPVRASACAYAPLRFGSRSAASAAHALSAVGVSVPFGVLASVPPMGKGRFAFELEREGFLLWLADAVADAFADVLALTVTLGGGGISVFSTRVVFFLGLGAF